MYLLVQHSGRDLHQHRGQVVARLAVAHLLQQHLAAVVNHLPDQSQAGFPAHKHSTFTTVFYIKPLSGSELLTG